jgi:hypothetical protein
MKVFSLDDLPDAVKKLNPGLCGDGVNYTRLDVEEQERHLQAACETWLVGRGYRRRTRGMILEGQPERGWFVHLHQAEGNPLLLDLLILGNDGRWVEIELKTSTGKLRDFQARLVNDGAGLARDIAGFVGLVLEWERWGEEDARERGER